MHKKHYCIVITRMISSKYKPVVGPWTEWRTYANVHTYKTIKQFRKYYKQHKNTSWNQSGQISIGRYKQRAIVQFHAYEVESWKEVDGDGNVL